MFKQNLFKRNGIFFDVCKKSVVYICVSLFLGSGFFPFVYLSIFMPIPYCLDYYNFTMSLIQVVNVQLCSPFTDLFWPSRYFVFPYEFHNQLVNIYQKTHWDFCCDCIKYINQFGDSWHFNNIKSSKPMNRIYLFLYLGLL